MFSARQGFFSGTGIPEVGKLFVIKGEAGLCDATSITPTGELVASFRYAYATPKYTILAKFDNSGAIMWQQKINLHTFFTNIVVDSAGNIYAYGNDSTNTYSYLIKFSSDGTVQWQKQTNYNASSYGKVLLNVAESKIYIGGNNYLTVFDNNGNLLNYKSVKVSYSTFGQTTVQLSHIDSSENIYLTGTCADSTSSSMGVYVKLNSSLASLGAGSYGTINTNWRFNNMYVDGSNNLIFIGQYWTTTPTNANTFVMMRPSSSITPLWAYKMNNFYYNYSPLDVSNGKIYTQGTNSTTIPSNILMSLNYSNVSASINYQNNFIMSPNTSTQYISTNNTSVLPSNNVDFSFGGGMLNGTTYTASSVVLPKDGTGLGSYATGIGNFTYSNTTNITLSSISLPSKPAVTLSITTPSVTSTTSSISITAGSGTFTTANIVN